MPFAMNMPRTTLGLRKQTGITEQFQCKAEGQSPSTRELTPGSEAEVD